VVVAEMETRFAELGCAHTAPFAFTYLEMTREVGRSVATSTFFEDPPVMAQLDAIFARLYFDAIDSWDAGRHDNVPPVWRIAFQAAEEGRTSVAADLFLGMNAHISRDLAYAVAAIISADTGMLDDLTDYVRVNEVMAAVQGPMLAGAAAQFDPSLAELDAVVPAEAGLTSIDLIGRWRQLAFDSGQRLALAQTPEEAAAVAAEIERNAVASAVMILNADSSLAVEAATEDTLDRDEYCESRR
jgi:hypothetical protein